ncbi:MAG: DUF1289 domain-containing protein [Brevundimonas sp.]|nr:MAG: DUF1289 domain-containing protein [Brevundimonas sp.]
MNSSSSVTPPPRSVATPCIQVCTVDGASGLCLGCRRSLAEIARWSRLSDEERDQIMAELPGRNALCQKPSATSEPDPSGAALQNPGPSGPGVQIASRKR